MGLIANIRAVGAIKKIRNGGVARLSVSQITSLLVNMPDAQRNLSPMDFQRIYSLFKKLIKDNTSYIMDYEHYVNTSLDIIMQFNQIASYEKYSGSSELELDLIMKEIRAREEKEKTEQNRYLAEHLLVKILEDAMQKENS